MKVGRFKDPLYKDSYFGLLVAEWIHFTLFGIILPTVTLQVYTFGGLMNSAAKNWDYPTYLHPTF